MILYTGFNVEPNTAIVFGNPPDCEKPSIVVFEIEGNAADNVIVKGAVPLILNLIRCEPQEAFAFASTIAWRNVPVPSPGFGSTPELSPVEVTV